MDVLGRDNAPFSGRVWREIDAAINGVKQAECTARRFLEVEGPYGLGLTSIVGDEVWLDRNSPALVGPGAPPAVYGGSATAWNVPQATAPPPGADLDQVGGRGTYLAYSDARPVPVVTSEFFLGVRNVEAFDDECQPLDVQR